MSTNITDSVSELTGYPEHSYAHFVEILKKKPADLLAEMAVDVAKLDLIHMALGISTESGELLTSIKAHTMYGKPLDRANLVEELGDLQFYMQGLMNACGIWPEEVEEHNRLKLETRYAKGFTNAAALARADKPEGE